MPADPPPPLKRALYLFAGVLATVAVTISTGTPSNPFRWVALIIGAVILVFSTTGFVSAGKPRPKDPARPRFRIRRTVVLGGLAVLITGTLVWAVGPRAGGWAEATDVWWSGCDHPTMLRVLATPEGVEPIRYLADEYQRHTARDHHGCPAVRMHVYAEPPDEARERLLNGWPNVDGGAYPRPDLWLPDSTLYASEALAGSTDRLVGVTTTVVASSAIVLAVPAGAAAREVDGARHGRTWSELIAMADERGWGLARPDPVASTVGRLATVALYTDEGHPDRIAPIARTRAVEQQLARGLDAGHYPPGTESSLLCQHRREGTSPTAVIVTEQAMVRFNQGAGLGGRCASAGTPLPEEQILTAFYPSDTFTLDHPVVAIRWADTSPAQRAAADGFTAWLKSSGGRSVLLSLGLRPQRTTISEPVSQRFGAVPGLGATPKARALPAEPAVEAVLAAQRRAVRHSRVLLMLDASGSMGLAVPGASTTRFGVAAAGVQSALSYLGERDEFGLWVYPGAPGAVRSLVPIGPASPPARRDAAAHALATVRPGGPTPLRPAVQQAVRAVGASDDTRSAAVVILTDGQDQDAALTEGPLREEARDRRVRVFVLAVGAASCARQGLADLADGTGGACFDAEVRGTDKVLEDLFRSLWGGP
ncbi:substrate-binding domain-containing protein [Phytohabitans sp. ZYX-F-186]|uniref:Substrate-binding domain-containing protein n=1 Tax=Phytohabitans maris TaxID=3071409 RepID=A0ABU0ZKV8_9ACTN|nr:substrate-binding domain-containing protein [Phytohabitans sp. ZYX-F-186]MDQ7906890.1 substrate-binding domain-containing protein [Phytohabitans sp. ZYX-F-186]